MQFCGKRKITLNFAVFINTNGSWQCLQIKTCMGVLALFIIQSYPNWFVHFWMTFCKNSIRMSCQIIFVNTHWSQSCQGPVKIRGIKNESAKPVYSVIIRYYDCIWHFMNQLICISLFNLWILKRQQPWQIHQWVWYPIQPSAPQPEQQQPTEQR